MNDSLKLIVFSDSHGDFAALDSVVRRHLAEPGVFIHLGDGAREVEELRMLYPNIDLRFVPGNCDFYCTEPDVGEIKFGGCRAVFTHGHTRGVKLCDDNIVALARSRGASLLMHGHTHLPRAEYDGGLHILCPGSVSRNVYGGATYAVVEIGRHGVLTNIIRLDGNVPSDNLRLTKQQGGGA